MRACQDILDLTPDHQTHFLLPPLFSPCDSRALLAEEGAEEDPQGAHSRSIAACTRPRLLTPLPRGQRADES